VDETIMLPAIRNGFSPSVINKIKSKLSSRGSKSKVASNTSSRPPLLKVKEEPGVTTRKRANTSDASNASKKPKKEDADAISNDDEVANTDKLAAKQSSKSEATSSQAHRERRSKNKHEQGATAMEVDNQPPIEEVEKNKKDKKKDKKNKKEEKDKTSQEKK
ncbi:hypothetical protein A2U01_0033593, partial [Trifolium medium]|nr:hypothetical protein [Trifolium medium]